jgi:hypothetical protein
MIDSRKRRVEFAEGFYERCPAVDERRRPGIANDIGDPHILTKHFFIFVRKMIGHALIFVDRDALG